jgi:hypothetical protein
MRIDETEHKGSFLKDNHVVDHERIQSWAWDPIEAELLWTRSLIEKIFCTGMLQTLEVVV